jgi:hypothetical protein
MRSIKECVRSLFKQQLLLKKCVNYKMPNTRSGNTPGGIWQKLQAAAPANAAAVAQGLAAYKAKQAAEAAKKPMGGRKSRKGRKRGTRRKTRK